jgi:hypothetical protein
MSMTLSLQIAALAAVLIVGGLTALKLAANSLDRQYPRQDKPGPRD